MRKNSDGEAKRPHGNTGRVVGPETRAKLSRVRKGQKHTPEAKARMSEARRGRTLTAETRAKISATTKARVAEHGHNQTRTWEVVTPEGVVLTVTNLNGFCQDNGLVQSRMSEVSRGLREDHHGWRCRKLT